VVPVDELGVAEDPAEPATGAWEQSTAHAEAVSVGDGALLEEGRPQALLGDRAAPADPKGLRLIGDGAVEESGVETSAG
jgi:hypothetical protein